MQQDVAKLFFAQVVAQAQARLMSSEYFSVDGTLIDARRRSRASTRRVSMRPAPTTDGTAAGDKAPAAVSADRFSSLRVPAKAGHRHSFQFFQPSQFLCWVCQTPVLL